MDDYFEDFDDDYDGGFEDDFEHDGGDGGLDDVFDENEMEEVVDADDDIPLEAEIDHSGRLQWQDWMVIGPLSEEIAREKREQERLRRNKRDNKF